MPRTRYVPSADLEAQYDQTSAQWSPALSDYVAEDQGWLEFVSVAEAPNVADESRPVPVVPRPPAPQVGGEPGRAHALGYTTGILPSRALRMPFGGETLVVPNQGPHPIQGEVGMSNRTDRLNTNVDALYRAWLPDARKIAETFRHPLAIHMDEVQE